MLNIFTSISRLTRFLQELSINKILKIKISDLIYANNLINETNFFQNF